MERPANPLMTGYIPPALRQWFNHIVVEALMRPFFVIVVDKLGNDAPQMPFAERNDSIEAFRPYREHEPLGVCVQVRTMRGKSHRLHAAAP